MQTLVTLFQIFSRSDVHRDSPRAKLRCKLTTNLSQGQASAGVSISEQSCAVGEEPCWSHGRENWTSDLTETSPAPISISTKSVTRQRTLRRPIRAGLISQFEPRAAYETTPRLDAPVGCVGVEDLPKAEGLPNETASSRRAALRKLGLLSLKSHFFSSTYCFPRRASNPD
jgi:hypothetical protein